MNYELGIMKQETIGCCGLVAWRRASPALQFTDMWRSETPEFHSAPAAVDPDTKGCAPRQPSSPGGDESQFCTYEEKSCVSLVIRNSSRTRGVMFSNSRMQRP